MSTAPEEYVVLRETTDHAAFVRLAQRQGWVAYRTYPRDDDASVFEDVWTTPDQRTAIHFVDDPSYGARLIRVRGDQVPEVLRVLARTLSFLDDDEMIEDASTVETLEEGIRSILRVGIGFPRHDPRALHTYRAYLQHAHSEMRRAAIKAIAYHHWPEAQELLAEAAVGDPDPQVRAFAAQVLETSKQRHGTV